MKKLICIVIMVIFFGGAIFADEQIDDIGISESDFDLSPIDLVLDDDFSDKVFQLRVESNGNYSYEDYKRDKTLNLSEKSNEPPLLRDFEMRKDVDNEITLLSRKLYYGNLSMGGKLKSNYLDPDKSSSSSVFSKYKYGRLTLNSEYTRKDNERNYEYSERFKFTSEYNIYGDFSLKYIFNQKVNSDTYQRGVGIKYKPKQLDEIVEFSADVQNKYTSTTAPSQQLNFETKLYF